MEDTSLRAGVNNRRCAKVIPSTMALMLDAEERSQINPQYLKTVQEEKDECSRKDVISWMRVVCAMHSSSLQAYCIAVNLFDRYASVRKIEKAKTMLVGASCLLVASKSVGTCSINAAVLYESIPTDFTLPELFRMEMTVLLALKWKIYAVTPLDFIGVLKAKVKLNKAQIRSVANVAKLVLPPACYENQYLSFPPSLLACGIIVLGALLGHEDPRTVKMVVKKVLKVFKDIYDKELVKDTYGYLKALWQVERLCSYFGRQAFSSPVQVGDVCTAPSPETMPESGDQRLSSSDSQGGSDRSLVPSSARWSSSARESSPARATSPTRHRSPARQPSPTREPSPSPGSKCDLRSPSHLSAACTRPSSPDAASSPASATDDEPQSSPLSSPKHEDELLSSAEQSAWSGSVSSSSYSHVECELSLWDDDLASDDGDDSLSDSSTVWGLSSAASSTEDLLTLCCQSSAGNESLTEASLATEASLTSEASVRVATSSTERQVTAAGETE